MLRLSLMILFLSFLMTACGTRCVFLCISTIYTYSIQQNTYSLIHKRYVYFNNGLYLDIDGGSVDDTVWLQPYLFAWGPHCCQNRKEKYFLNLILTLYIVL